MISSLFAFILRVALLAALTFLFVVLFEHGPENYLGNVQTDFGKLYHSVTGENLPAARLAEPESNR